MRPGGEKRGNNRNRKQRKRWMLRTFDTDLGPDHARCHLKISGDRCHEVLDFYTVTADRIDPDGPYRHENIRPACAPCQNLQGALITRARREEWRQWQEEAAYYGIDTEAFS